jgi:translation initiation factor 4G
LNKITLENFESLAKKISDITSSDAMSLAILTGIIDLVFDKALGEPKFSQIYAELCYKLSRDCRSFEGEGEEKPKIVCAQC